MEPICYANSEYLNPQDRTLSLLLPMLCKRAKRVNGKELLALDAARI